MDFPSTPKVSRGSKYWSSRKKKRSSNKHLDEEENQPQIATTTKAPETTETETIHPENHPFSVTPENNDSESSEKESPSDLNSESDEEFTSNQSGQTPTAKGSNKFKKKGISGRSKNKNPKRGRNRRNCNSRRNSDAPSLGPNFGEIPDIPDDFKEFPFFLTKQFNGIVPSIFVLQGLLYGDINCHSYESFDRSMQLGGDLSHCMDPKAYHYHLDSIIQLRIIWEFLCAKQSRKLKVPKGESVSFSHFMQYKEKHFDRITKKYQILLTKGEAQPTNTTKPPGYTRVSPIVKEEEYQEPFDSRSYRSNPPNMFWEDMQSNDRHYITPGFDPSDHESDSSMDESSNGHSIPWRMPFSGRGERGGRGRGPFRNNNRRNRDHGSRSFTSQRSDRSRKDPSYVPSWGTPDNPSIYGGESKKTDRYYRKMTTMRAAKSRSTMNHKISWNGNRQTFDEYRNKVEGHLLQVGAGYLIDPVFLDKYATHGIHYFEESGFYDAFLVSIPQARWDSQYLYGILKSSLTCRSNPHLSKHSPTRDGISVWMAYIKEYSNSGSNTVRIQQLESKLHKQYSPRQGSIPDYVDTFQTIMSELEGLYIDEESAGRPAGHLNDAQKKRWLLNAVATDAALQPLVQRLREGTHSYEEVAHKVRSTALQTDYDLNPSGKPRRAMKATTDMDTDSLEPQDDHSAIMDNAMRMFHTVGRDVGYRKAYNMIGNPRTMESLKIPRSIWLELTDRLKDEMNAIRDRIREKRSRAQGGDTRPTDNKDGKGDNNASKHLGSTPDAIPSQYPSMKKPSPKRANLASMEEEISRACDAFDDLGFSEDDMEEATDDDEVFSLHMIRTGMNNPRKVQIEIPGNGTVEPELLRNRTISDRVHNNARMKKNKRELEAILRKKVGNLLLDLRRKEKDSEKTVKEEFGLQDWGADNAETTELMFYDSDSDNASDRDKIGIYRRIKERQTQRHAKKLIDKLTHNGKVRSLSILQILPRHVPS